jgi:phosphate transport system permease protein
MAQALLAEPPAAAIDLQMSDARRRRETRMRWLFKAAAIFTFAISIAILYILIKDALAFFIDVPKGSLWQIGWFPRRGMFDLLTLFYGSLIVGLIAMLVAAPIGLGSAVYLSEYAPPRVRRVLKPTLELLASIPSVVLGYFAISFINPEIVVNVFSSANRAFTLLAAGLAVGLLTTPLVASVAEDALRAVPRELREASFGIGARRSTTAVRVVFPAAISGIMAALLLGIARAVGETMVVAIAAGAVGGGLRTLDPLGPGQTLTAAMAALGFGSDQVAGDDLAFKSLYFLGFLLFLFTLGLNLLGDKLVRRLREAY